MSYTDDCPTLPPHKLALPESEEELRALRGHLTAACFFLARGRKPGQALKAYEKLRTKVHAAI